MDHFSGTDGTHPLRRMAAEVSASVKEVADLDPMFMSPQDRAAVLAELDEAEDQLRLVKLRVVGSSGDLAAEAGFKSLAGWRALEHRRDVGAARAEERLAEALGQRWVATADGVRDGRVSMEQAKVIVKGLDDLADALAEEVADCDTSDKSRSQAWVDDVLARGEAHLIEQAEEFGPKNLERLAEKLLSVVAPDHVEELERRALERAERRAAAETRLTMRGRGDGSTQLSARIPDKTAAQLKTFLGSITSPRSSSTTTSTTSGSGSSEPVAPVVDPWIDPDTGRRVPQERRNGQAFVSLIERVTARDLPQHGGLGTSVVVTIDFESLRDGVGHGTIGDPDGDGVRVSAGEVRRLACDSGILPAVLGSDSTVLDLGRRQRFFTAAQRIAHNVNHPTCEAAGCDIPAAWCEAHHKRDPWAAGGTTDRADLANLCPWHHHRAHDPTYRTDWLPGGGVRFHRRR